MRFDYSWSFRWFAPILAGILSLAVGCSSPSERIPAPPAVVPRPRTSDPDGNGESPGALPEPAKSSETTPPVPDDMPDSDTARWPTVLPPFQPVEPETPAEPPKSDEPKKETSNSAGRRRTHPSPKPAKKDESKKDQPKNDEPTTKPAKSTAAKSDKGDDPTPRRPKNPNSDSGRNHSNGR